MELKKFSLIYKILVPYLSHSSLNLNNYLLSIHYLF